MKRILSLDGGGSWAILQAMALDDIYGEIPGRKLLANYDLVVANSGGSIVLAGLMQDKTPNQIINLFSDRKTREAIFAPLPFFRRQLSRLPLFPRYSIKGKREGLGAVFGEAAEELLSSYSGANRIENKNGEDVRFLIAAYGYDSRRAAFFRSYPTRSGGKADDITVADAVNASSAAPIKYFDGPAQWKNLRSWDGAMAGLNTPILAGAVDLLSEGVSVRDVTILSLGTATVQLPPPTVLPKPPPELTQPVAQKGIVRDFQRAATAILDDPPDFAPYVAHVFLSSAQDRDPVRIGPVIRLSPSISPVLKYGVWQVPNGLTPDQFQRLMKLGMDAIKDDDITLIKTLGRAWMAGDVMNQPIRMDSNFVTSLGETYPEGKARWQKGETSASIAIPK